MTNQPDILILHFVWGAFMFCVSVDCPSWCWEKDLAFKLLCDQVLTLDSCILTFRHYFLLLVYQTPLKWRLFNLIVEQMSLTLTSSKNMKYVSIFQVFKETFDSWKLQPWFQMLIQNDHFWQIFNWKYLDVGFYLTVFMDLCQISPVWDVPQAYRLVANRCECHNWV